jgi:hypothetical protein
LRVRPSLRAGLATLGRYIRDGSLFQENAVAKTGLWAALPPPPTAFAGDTRRDESGGGLFPRQPERLTCTV